MTEPTLRHWRVGYVPRPVARGGVGLAAGILLPWFADGLLWHLNVRRAAGEPKYKAAAGGHPLHYGMHTLAHRAAAVLCEGEFDTMLLGQEAGDLVGVATLGSCSRRLNWRAMAALLDTWPVLVAYDADAAGQQGARTLEGLSRRLRRVSVPLGNDVTEFWQRGGRLRDWIAFELERCPRPPAALLPAQRTPPAAAADPLGAYEAALAGFSAAGVRLSDAPRDPPGETFLDAANEYRLARERYLASRASLTSDVLEARLRTLGALIRDAHGTAAAQPDQEGERDGLLAEYECRNDAGEAEVF